MPATTNTLSCPVNTTPRGWQRRLGAALPDHPERSFLLAATPGAGKTRPALGEAKRLLATGRIDRVVALTPTRNLCEQWADRGHAAGLTLDPSAPVVEASDIDGVVMTYTGLVHAAEHQRALAARKRTLVIGDEIHHLGEERRQGEAFIHAFEPAERLLLLSGTPFRSDAARIPFITYDSAGISVPDFSYSYSEAIRDGVCRRVVFEEWDGTFSWLSGEGSREASFGDELPDRDAARRLRTALRADLLGLQLMLAGADNRLEEVRQHHPDAGGLAVALDIRHAEQIGRVLEQITGSAPVVVTSADADANRRIDRFSESADRWIVAVNMVSEGVDIPRLRVGAYCSNVTTSLRFRQVVGRFVRTGSGPETEPSYLFLPADQRLVAEARRITEEISHRIEEAEELDGAPEAGEKESTDTGSFVPLSAEMGAAGAIADGVGFSSASEAAAIATLAQARGLSVNELVSALPGGDDSAEEFDEEPAVIPRHVEVQHLRRARKRLVGRLYHLLKEQLGDGPIDHRTINGWVNVMVGIRHKDSATLEQRRQVDRLLREEIQSVQAGGGTRIPA